MGEHAAVVVYMLTIVAVIVGVDVLFFRHHFRQRLIAQRRSRPNVRGVLLRFLKRP